MLTSLFVVIIVTSTFKNLLLSLIMCNCMCLPLSMYMGMYGYRGPWRPEVSDLPKLGLRKAVSHLTWVLGTELGSPARAVSSLHN